MGTDPPAAPPEREARPIGLLDLVLLGVPDGRDELVGGRVYRGITFADAHAARSAFLSLARELCELAGMGWTTRFVDGKDRVDFGRGHLRVEGDTVELALDVSPETWRLFKGGG